ncbi:lanthionine synthetase LanC family protein, partial [Nonomuraea sp. NPDC050783]|uniref:lanthionine synthetase LanC family protein n=1 Tax=Nonomuraea sp. NPDC050783 TaxID=3154634 RepID=UPI0034654301
FAMVAAAVVVAAVQGVGAFAGGQGAAAVAAGPAPGIATGDHARRQRAELALAAWLSDPAQLARIRDPALCHGWAGLLATVWHASCDDSTGELATHLPGLLATLLHHADHADHGEHDGLIEGRAGVALLLHTMTAGTSTRWEPCLLIT